MELKGSQYLRDPPIHLFRNIIALPYPCAECHNGTVDPLFLWLSGGLTRVALVLLLPLNLHLLLGGGSLPFVVRDVILKLGCLLLCTVLFRKGC